MKSIKEFLRFNKIAEGLLPSNHNSLNQSFFNAHVFDFYSISKNGTIVFIKNKITFKNLTESQFTALLAAYEFKTGEMAQWDSINPVYVTFDNCFISNRILNKLFELKDGSTLYKMRKITEYKFINCNFSKGVLDLSDNDSLPAIENTTIEGGNVEVLLLPKISNTSSNKRGSLTISNCPKLSQIHNMTKLGATITNCPNLKEFKNCEVAYSLSLDNVGIRDFNFGNDLIRTPRRDDFSLQINNCNNLTTVSMLYFADYKIAIENCNKLQKIDLQLAPPQKSFRPRRELLLSNNPNLEEFNPKSKSGISKYVQIKNCPKLRN